MATEKFSAEITVQKYQFGKPFPGLVAHLDQLASLPKEAQTILPGGISPFSINPDPFRPKAGIVLAGAEYVVVFDGQYMQVTDHGVGGYNQIACVGRVPIGFKPVS